MCPKVIKFIRDGTAVETQVVNFLTQALCLPRQSKLCFKILQNWVQSENRDQGEVE